MTTPTLRAALENVTERLERLGIKAAQVGVEFDHAAQYAALEQARAALAREPEPRPPSDPRIANTFTLIVTLATKLADRVVERIGLNEGIDALVGAIGDAATNGLDLVRAASRDEPRTGAPAFDPKSPRWEKMETSYGAASRDEPRQPDTPWGELFGVVRDGLRLSDTRGVTDTRPAVALAKIQAEFVMRGQRLAGCDEPRPRETGWREEAALHRAAAGRDEEIAGRVHWNGPLGDFEHLETTIHRPVGRDEESEPHCPDCGTATLQPAKVAGYLYCTRCGKGSIPVPPAEPSAGPWRDEHFDRGDGRAACGYVGVLRTTLTDNTCPKCLDIMEHENTAARDMPSVPHECAYKHEASKATEDYIKASRERFEAQDRVKRLENAIIWALGSHPDDQFRRRRIGEGAFYWRTELRERAFGVSRSTTPKEGL